jgi:integrase
VERQRRRSTSRRTGGPGKNGQPLVNIATAWNVARRRANLDHPRFHDVRHVFASYLVMRGESLRLVQELLGHQSLDMVQRYSHLRPEATRAAVDGLSFREQEPAYELRVLPQQAHSA